MLVAGCFPIVFNRLKFWKKNPFSGETLLKFWQKSTCLSSLIKVKGHFGKVGPASGSVGWEIWFIMDSEGEFGAGHVRKRHLNLHDSFVCVCVRETSLPYSLTIPCTKK